MRLKLDENFGRRGAEILADAGHDVAIVPAENVCRATDHEVARACRTEGPCPVTFDLDVGNPLLFKPADYPGIPAGKLTGWQFFPEHAPDGLFKGFPTRRNLVLQRRNCA